MRHQFDLEFGLARVTDRRPSRLVQPLGGFGPVTGSVVDLRRHGAASLAGKAHSQRDRETEDECRLSGVAGASGALLERLGDESAGRPGRDALRRIGENLGDGLLVEQPR